MKLKIIIKTTLAFVALAAVTLAPTYAVAQEKGKSKGHVKQGQRNPAPPKKNGRHDNRNWNKKKSNEDHRSSNSDDDNRNWNQNRSNNDGKWVNGRWIGTNANLSREEIRRQQSKNEWRNIALLSGAVALLGVVNKDKTLVFAGSAGALYSLYRYEQDRKSQSQANRLRASYFSRPYFVRDGVRYDRRVMVKNGEKNYQFFRRS